jgi:hypothetical protein
MSMRKIDGSRRAIINENNIHEGKLVGPGLEEETERPTMNA